MKGKVFLSALAAASIIMFAPCPAAAVPHYFPMDIVPEEYLQEFGADGFFSCSEISDELFRFMAGKSFKEGGPVTREDLRYLLLLHRDVRGNAVVGEMVVSKSIAYQVLAIFQELFEDSYPIEKVRLIDWYDGDDEASMRDNNSSSFNIRNIGNSTKISRHAYGEAVDINPLYNPEYKVTSSGQVIVEPGNAAAYLDREADFPYKIVMGDFCHSLFIRNGFTWGGSWTSLKDYQHFEFSR